jgi:hypothetical protein
METDQKDILVDKISQTVSEFRQEAAKSDIGAIVADLKTALKEQNVRLGRVEEQIQSSNDSEKVLKENLIKISNSLEALISSQSEILKNIKNANKSVNEAKNNVSSTGETSSGGGGFGGLIAGGGLGLLGAAVGPDLISDAQASSQMPGGGRLSHTTTQTAPQPSRGMTPEISNSIREFSSRYNINPNALASVLSVETGGSFDPSRIGGAGNNFTGIFQLQTEQIAGLTESVFGRSMSREEYMRLSFDEQLRVYERYMLNALRGEENAQNFFSGDPEQDAARLWALQLAPSRARSLDYSDPNTVISRTNQADVISQRRGLVTVGSAAGSLERGGLFEVPNESVELLTPRSGFLGENIPSDISLAAGKIPLRDEIGSNGRFGASMYHPEYSSFHGGESGRNWADYSQLLYVSWEELPNGVNLGTNTRTITDPISGEQIQTTFNVIESQTENGEIFYTVSQPLINDETGSPLRISVNSGMEIASQLQGQLPSREEARSIYSNSDVNLELIGQGQVAGAAGADPLMSESGLAESRSFEESLRTQIRSLNLEEPEEPISTTPPQDPPPEPNAVSTNAQPDQQLNETDHEVDWASNIHRYYA